MMDKPETQLESAFASLGLQLPPEAYFPLSFAQDELFGFHEMDDLGAGQRLPSKKAKRRRKRPKAKADKRPKKAKRQG